jgi:hypothetical protein
LIKKGFENENLEAVLKEIKCTSDKQKRKKGKKEESG